MSGIREVLAARWGDMHAAEDVIGAYRRTLDRHGARVRFAVFSTGDPDVAGVGAERLAWGEGARALWMHMLSVAGRAYEAHAPSPQHGLAPPTLDETFLSDLGAEAHFWSTNAAFALPVEFAFHAGRLAAFGRVCALGDVDPYHLRRPKPADHRE